MHCTYTEIMIVLRGNWLADGAGKKVGAVAKIGTGRITV